jgi:hypothetical protein
MKACIFDIETDGFLDVVSKMHVLYFKIVENNNLIDEGAIIDPIEVLELFQEDYLFVGHNIIRYDLPVLNKLFGLEWEHLSIFDTLGISWYLRPNQKQHSLEYWGLLLGAKKVEIEDWSNLSLSDYILRCQMDTEINLRLYKLQIKELLKIYDESYDSIVNYCNFKLDCLREQEAGGIYLDVEKCNENLEKLQKIFDEKTILLQNEMPSYLGKLVKTKPKTFYKKDLTISSNGIKYIQELVTRKLPMDSEEIRDKPNPGSTSQLKEWLMSLGWQPITFKVSEATGEQVPQISLPFGQGLCPSIIEMFETYPVLEELDTYSKVKHRIGILNGYLEELKEGKVVAKAHGYTKTMRLKHAKPIANLPKPSVLYGKEVREVLYAPESYTMVGCDIAGLEDATKQHYIYYYDPQYVKDMRTEGFDPHIDIGLLAGLITQEEADLFKFVESLSDQEKKDIEEGKAKIYKIVKKKRGTAKQVNFACVYGAGAPKIAETAKISLVEAELLHSIYWKRNWAVKEIAKHVKVKTIDGQMWLFNPLSGFWMYLDNDKDRFSSLNQSTGVFVFDLFVKEARKRLKKIDVYICLQYHDEILLWFKTEKTEQVKTILRESINRVNEILKLNVEINISIDVGQNYAECH